MAAFVGYYRVSTASQGRSGLGLEAQRAAVEKFVAGSNGRLVGQYQEIESGSSGSRSALIAALHHCKREEAILVIARLDRLARNLSFISQLMESGVEFIAADMPAANKLTIHILAAMAEHERDLISQRTIASLAAAKARGVKLGNPRVAEASALAAESRKRRADDFALRVGAVVSRLCADMSYARSAQALNEMGWRTQNSKSWTAAGVRNVAIRAKRLAAEADQ